MLAAKRVDPLNVRSKDGWNSTVYLGHRFPDKPLMRQLAKYDSLRRADYNYRAETLDHTSTEKYVPRGSKFQYNERHITSATRNLESPPSCSRTEFPVHAALADKKRWDPATGHAGDPYAAQKARDRQQEAALALAQANSRRRQPSKRMSLLERERSFSATKREEKAARRTLEAAGCTWRPPPAPLSERDAFEMSRQVPALRTTTWSLGSI